MQIKLPIFRVLSNVFLPLEKSFILKHNEVHRKGNTLERLQKIKEIFQLNFVLLLLSDSSFYFMFEYKQNIQKSYANILPSSSCYHSVCNNFRVDVRGDYFFTLSEKSMYRLYT